jgi:glycerophosphoryl diester phosphodiesterase
MIRLDWPNPSADEGPLLIAHRGASGSFPENTEASFLGALAAGARTWECDARLTRDGVPVVMHDAHVERTTDGKGFVREIALVDLRRFSAGYRLRFGEQFVRQRVPTLEEVLRLARGEARLLIELKTDGGDSGRSDDLARAVVDQITAAGAYYQTALISFDPAVLVQARSAAREVNIGLLVSSRAPGDPLETLRAIEARLLIVSRDLLSPALLEAAKQASVPVATYTVQNEEELESVLPQRLYAVATDFPERFKDNPAIRRA